MLKILLIIASLNCFASNKQELTEEVITANFEVSNYFKNRTTQYHKICIINTTNCECFGGYVGSSRTISCEFYDNLKKKINE